MLHEVYVFGDSHWRLFFPFVNQGDPGVCYEQDGVVVLDTTGNQLSGATMWGLQNENSTHRARRRILETIDERDGIENIALVFGEVDVRYHWNRYFDSDGCLLFTKVVELVLVYRRFIEEDLLRSGRVRNKVFIYYGFRYNPPTPSQFHRDRPPTAGHVLTLHRVIEGLLPLCMRTSAFSDRIVVVCPGAALEGEPGTLHPRFMDIDGIHPLPNPVFNEFVMPVLKRELPQ